MHVAIGIERQRRIDACILVLIAARRRHAPTRGNAAGLRVIGDGLVLSDGSHRDDEAGLLREVGEVEIVAAIRIDAGIRIGRLYEGIERDAVRIDAGDRIGVAVVAVGGDDDLAVGKGGEDGALLVGIYCRGGPDRLLLAGIWTVAGVEQHDVGQPGEILDRGHRGIGNARRAAILTLGAIVGEAQHDEVSSIRDARYAACRGGADDARDMCAMAVRRVVGDVERVIRAARGRQPVVAAARVDLSGKGGMRGLDAGIADGHGDARSVVAQCPCRRRTDQVQAVLLGVRRRHGLPQGRRDED